jgi:hypothetical protein
MTFYKSCYLICLLTIVLFGCVSPPAPYEEREAVYNFHACEEETDNDFSYPVTGNIAVTGTLVYIPREPTALELFGLDFLSKKEKKVPSLPANDTEILVSGLLKTPDSSKDTSWVRFYTKNSRGLRPVWFTKYYYDYIWDGIIMFNGTRKNAKLYIYEYVMYGSGDVKLVEMNSAKNQPSGIDFTHLIGTDAVVDSPPFQWGKFISDTEEYGLYAVIETNYYAKYPDFTQEDREKAKWLASTYSKVDNYFEFFLKAGQKFQLINSAGLVVAEIYGNTYTIYDILPESEWDGMKQNMALFYVFRLIARRIFYSSAEYSIFF